MITNKRSTVRPRHWHKLVRQLDGEDGESKPQRTNCTASNICVHTVKSTAALHIGCFCHFGSLTWAPLEAINFKPQSLLPVFRLTFPPLLKEGRVEEKKKEAKSNLLFLYEIYSPGVRVNNDLIYQWLPCYLHCFRHVVSACDWAELFSRMERGAWGPGRLTSVWSKFMWNFLGPPGESLFMNCNKKSHFDGVTPVHRQEGGRIWLCLCLQGGGALTEKEIQEVRKKRMKSQRWGDEKTKWTCGGCASERWKRVEREK